MALPPQHQQQLEHPDASSMPPDVYAAAVARQQQQQQQQTPVPHQYSSATPSSSSQQQQLPMHQQGLPHQMHSQTKPSQSYQQPLSQLLPPQQVYSSPAGGAAPIADGEPPVPGTEEAVVAKAPKAAKPSYSSAPVLHTPAVATAAAAVPQVPGILLKPAFLF